MLARPLRSTNSPARTFSSIFRHRVRSGLIGARAFPGRLEVSLIGLIGEMPLGAASHRLRAEATAPDPRNAGLSASPGQSNATSRSVHSVDVWLRHARTARRRSVSLDPAVLLDNPDAPTSSRPSSCTAWITWTWPVDVITATSPCGHDPDLCTGRLSVQTVPQLSRAKLRFSLLRRAKSALSVFALGAGGALTLTGDIGAADGWAFPPRPRSRRRSSRAVTSPFVAGTGSSSLTVIEVAEGGAPVIRDHVVDALATRFQGVEALAVHEAGGRTFVVAGGADDGLSSSRSPRAAGSFTSRASRNSVSTTSPMSPPSQLSDTGRICRLSPPGLETRASPASRCRCPGSARRFARPRHGGAALGHGAGRHFSPAGVRRTRFRRVGKRCGLIDGGGGDTLTGGSVRGPSSSSSQMDSPDIVTDFEPGIDRLDLSAFHCSNSSVGNSRPCRRTGGVRLVWRDETIDLYRAGGGTIDISGGRRSTFSTSTGRSSCPSPGPSRGPGGRYAARRRGRRP